MSSRDTRKQRRVDPTEEAERLSARTRSVEDLQRTPRDDNSIVDHSFHTAKRFSSSGELRRQKLCDSDMEELSEILMTPEQQEEHSRTTEPDPIHGNSIGKEKRSEANLNNNRAPQQREQGKTKTKSEAEVPNASPHRSSPSRKSQREETRRRSPIHTTAWAALPPKSGSPHTRQTTTHTAHTSSSNGGGGGGVTHHRRRGGGERIDITRTPALHHHHPEHDANRELQYRLQFLNGGRGPSRRNHGDGALLVYGGGSRAGEGGKKALSQSDLDLLRSSEGSRRERAQQDTSFTMLQDSVTTHERTSTSATLSDDPHHQKNKKTETEASPSCYPEDQDTTLAPHTPQSDHDKSTSSVLSLSPNPVRPHREEEAQELECGKRKKRRTTDNTKGCHCQEGETITPSGSGRGDDVAAAIHRGNKQGSRKKHSREHKTTPPSPSSSGRKPGEPKLMSNSQRAGSYLSSSSCGLSPDLWRSQSSPVLDGPDAVEAASRVRQSSRSTVSPGASRVGSHHHLPKPTSGPGLEGGSDESKKQEPNDTGSALAHMIRSDGRTTVVTATTERGSSEIESAGGMETRPGKGRWREIEVEVQLFPQNAGGSSEATKQKGTSSPSKSSAGRLLAAEKETTPDKTSSRRHHQTSQQQASPVAPPPATETDLLRRAMVAAFAAGEDPAHNGELSSHHLLDILHAATSVGRRDQGVASHPTSSSSRLGTAAAASSSSMSSAAAAAAAIQRFGHQWLWEHQSAISSSSTSSARMTPPGSSSSVKISGLSETPVRVARGPKQPKDGAPTSTKKRKAQKAQKSKSETTLEEEFALDDDTVEETKREEYEGGTREAEGESDLPTSLQVNGAVPAEMMPGTAESRFITREELKEVILSVLKVMREYQQSQHSEDAAGDEKETKAAEATPASDSVASTTTNTTTSSKSTLMVDATTSPRPLTTLPPPLEEDAMQEKPSPSADRPCDESEPLSAASVVRKGMPSHVVDGDTDSEEEGGDNPNMWEVPTPPSLDAKQEVVEEQEIGRPPFAPASASSSSSALIGVTKQYRTSLDRHEPLRRRRRSSRGGWSSSSSSQHTISSTQSLSASLNSPTPTPPPAESPPTDSPAVEGPHREDGVEYRDRSPSVSPSENVNQTTSAVPAEPSDVDPQEKRMPSETVDWTACTPSPAADATHQQQSFLNAAASTTATTTTTEGRASSDSGSGGVVIRLPPGVEEAEAARIAALPPHLRPRHSPSPVVQRHHLHSSASSSGSLLSASGSPFFQRRSPGETPWLRSRSSISPSPMTTSVESILVNGRPAAASDSGAPAPREVSQRSAATQTLQDKETQYEVDQKDEHPSSATTATTTTPQVKTCEASTETDHPEAVTASQSAEQEKEKPKPAEMEEETSRSTAPDHLLSKLENRQPMGLAALRRKWEEEEVKRQSAAKMKMEQEQEQEQEAPLAPPSPDPHLSQDAQPHTVKQALEEGEEETRRAGSEQSVPISEEAARERGLISLILSEEHSRIPGGKLIVPTRRDKHRMTTISVSSSDSIGHSLSEGNPLGIHEDEDEDDDAREEGELQNGDQHPFQLQPTANPPTLSVKNLLAHATAHDEESESEDDEESTIIVSSDAFCEGEEDEEPRGDETMATPSSIVFTTFQEAPQEDVTHTPSNVTMYSMNEHQGKEEGDGEEEEERNNHDVEELRDMIARLHREVTVLRHGQGPKHSLLHPTSTSNSTITSRKEMKLQLESVLLQVRQLQQDRLGRHPSTHASKPQTNGSRASQQHESDEFARMEELLRSTIATLELSVSEMEREEELAAEGDGDDHSSNSSAGRNSNPHHLLLSSSEREEEESRMRSTSSTDPRPHGDHQHEEEYLPSGSGAGLDQPLLHVPSLDLRPLSLCSQTVTPLDPSLLSSTEEEQDLAMLSKRTRGEEDEDDTDMILSTPPAELLTARAEDSEETETTTTTTEQRDPALDVLQADVNRIKAENAWLYQQIILQQQQAAAQRNYAHMMGGVAENETEVNISLSSGSGLEEEPVSVPSSMREDAEPTHSSAKSRGRRAKHRYPPAPASPMEEEEQEQDNEEESFASSTGSSCVVLMSAPQDVLLNEEEVDEEEDDEEGSPIGKSSTGIPAATTRATIATSGTTSQPSTTTSAGIASSFDSHCMPSPSLPLLQASSGHLLSFSPHHHQHDQQPGSTSLPPHGTMTTDAAQQSIHPHRYHPQLGGGSGLSKIEGDSENVVLSSLVSADQYPARPSFFSPPALPVPLSGSAEENHHHNNDNENVATTTTTTTGVSQPTEAVSTPHGAPYSAAWMTELMAGSAQMAAIAPTAGVPMMDVVSMQREQQKRLNAMVQQTREDRLRIQMEHEADHALLQEMIHHDHNDDHSQSLPPLSNERERENVGHDGFTGRTSSSSSSNETETSSEIFISQPDYIRHVPPYMGEMLPQHSAASPMMIAYQNGVTDASTTNAFGFSESTIQATPAAAAEATTTTEEDSRETSTSASLEGKYEEEVVDILISRHHRHHRRQKHHSDPKAKIPGANLSTSLDSSTTSTSTSSDDDKDDTVLKPPMGGLEERAPRRTSTTTTTTVTTTAANATGEPAQLPSVAWPNGIIPGGVEEEDEDDKAQWTALQEQLLHLQNELQETIRSRQEMERRSLEDQEGLQDAHQAHVQRIHSMLNALQREQLEYEQDAAVRAVQGANSARIPSPSINDDGAAAAALSRITSSGDVQSGRRVDAEALDRQIQQLARELQQLHVAIKSTIQARDEIQTAAAAQSQEVRSRNAAEQATMDALLIHLGDRLRRAQIQQEQFQQEAVHLVEYASADHRAEMKRLHMEMEELQEVVAAATNQGRHHHDNGHEDAGEEQDHASRVQRSSSPASAFSARHGRRTERRRQAKEVAESVASTTSSSFSSSLSAEAEDHRANKKSSRHDSQPKSHRQEEELGERRREKKKSATSSPERNNRDKKQQRRLEEDRSSSLSSRSADLVDIAPHYGALAPQKGSSRSHRQGSRGNSSHHRSLPASAGRQDRPAADEHRLSEREKTTKADAAPKASPPTSPATRKRSSSANRSREESAHYHHNNSPNVSQLGPWGEERSESDEHHHSWMQQEPQSLSELEPHHHEEDPKDDNNNNSNDKKGDKIIRGPRKTSSNKKLSLMTNSAASENELSTTHLTSISLTGSLPSSGLSTARPNNVEDEGPAVLGYHDDDHEPPHHHTNTSAGPPPLRPSVSYPSVGRSPTSSTREGHPDPGQEPRPAQGRSQPGYLRKERAPRRTSSLQRETRNHSSSSSAGSFHSVASSSSSIHATNVSGSPSKMTPQQRRVSSPAPKPPRAPSTGKTDNSSAAPSIRYHSRSSTGTSHSDPSHLRQAQQVSPQASQRRHSTTSSNGSSHTSSHHRHRAAAASAGASASSPYLQPVRSVQKPGASSGASSTSVAPPKKKKPAPSVYYSVDMTNAIPLPEQGPSFSRFPQGRDASGPNPTQSSMRRDGSGASGDEGLSASVPSSPPPIPPAAPSLSSTAPSSSSTAAFSRPTTIAAAVAAAKQRSRSRSKSESGSRRAASSSSLSSSTATRTSPYRASPLPQRQSSTSAAASSTNRGRRYLRGARNHAGSSSVPSSLWVNIEENAPWDIHTLKLPPNMSLSAYSQQGGKRTANRTGSRSHRSTRSPDNQQQQQKRLKEQLLNVSDVDDDDGRYDYLLHRHGFFGEVYKFGVATSPTRRR